MSLNYEIDSRAISNELMNELTEGGLKEFLRFVQEDEKNDNNLALCFRGNDNPSSVVIYYNNHMVWKLNMQKKGSLSVTISFNHARYSKDWQEKLKELCSDYNFKGKQELKNGNIGYLKAKGTNFSKNFVKGSFEILKPLIDDFFNTDLKFDYFKNKESYHKNYIEKVRQQELYKEFDNLQNGLFVYDLEFAQKRLSGVSSNKNQPDMLGIRFKNGKPEKIVFIEVKSTELAVKDSKSGLKKHLEGMEKYIKEELVINNRIEDAYKILNQYNKLQLRKVSNVDKSMYNKLPIEIRFVLTDDAAKYVMKNKEYWKTRKNGAINILENYMLEKGYKVEYKNDNRIEFWK